MLYPQFTAYICRVKALRSPTVRRPTYYNPSKPCLTVGLFVVDDLVGYECGKFWIEKIRFPVPRLRKARCQRVAGLSCPGVENGTFRSLLSFEGWSEILEKGILWWKYAFKIHNMKYYVSKDLNERWWIERILNLIGLLRWEKRCCLILSGVLGLWAKPSKMERGGVKFCNWFIERVR